MISNKPILLIVSSPSGAGKTTLCKRLLKEFSDVRFSISHTTRKPRLGEKDGKDYFFIDQETFDNMKDKNLFVEWAHVHGNSYGTSHDEVKTAAENRMDLVFDIDYQGAQQIKEHYPDAITIFILPPSIDELKKRLSSRGTETSKSLEKRFTAALDEISHFEEFDYLLVNDNIDEAYEKLKSIIIAKRITMPKVAHLAQKLL